MTYAEGTYITYLRQKDENYIVDYYPLGIAEISDYLSNGQPVVLINMSKLKSALSKSMLKDKKNKALFFENQETEIQNNYPDEVYQAFKNGDTYAKLDVDHCGVIRIGNMGQKYGVSPLFRALRPALMLETFDTSDRVNAKAKAKKIIWQQLDPELMGPNKDKKGFSEQVTAHDNLLRAWKQNTVLVTTAPYVKDIKYVEPKVEMTNIETVKQYRNREMAALGISFLNTDGQQTVSTAKVSLDQLMKNIGKIAEQIEDVLKRWYRIRLEDAGVDPMYCPDVKVSTTEMMGMEMKKAIAQFLFTTLNCSYKTAYEYMGLHAEDELRKRQAETEEGYDDVFVARQTSYTSTGNSGGGGDSDKKTGRPKGEETEKQIYDQQRNEDSK